MTGYKYRSGATGMSDEEVAARVAAARETAAARHNGTAGPPHGAPSSALATGRHACHDMDGEATPTTPTLPLAQSPTGKPKGAVA